MEATIHQTLQKWKRSGKFEAFEFFKDLTLHLNSVCFCPEEILARYDEFSKYFFDADPQTSTKGMLSFLVVGSINGDDIRFTVIHNHT